MQSSKSSSFAAEKRSQLKELYTVNVSKKQKTPSQNKYHLFIKEFTKNMKNEGVSLPFSERMKVIGHLWQVEKIINKSSTETFMV